MADTAIAPNGINKDARQRFKLTDAAVKRAKEKLHAHTIDDLVGQLGFSRQTFWRLRKGKCDIPLSKAADLAALIGWPLDRAFERVNHG